MQWRGSICWSPRTIGRAAPSANASPPQRLTTATQLPSNGATRVETLKAPDGESLRVAYRRIVDDAGLDWLIFVVVPNSELRGNVVQITLGALALGLLALLGALLVGTCALSRVARDISDLSFALRALGDRALREVGERIREQLRDIDFAARLGGDEFVVVQHEPTDRDQVEELMKRLEHAITQPLTSLRDLPADAHVAVGAALGSALYPLDGENVSQLLQTAGQRMYLNKTRDR